nr:hypothetical protein [Mycobacterium sp. UM_NZ2]
MSAPTAYPANRAIHPCCGGIVDHGQDCPAAVLYAALQDPAARLATHRLRGG